MESHFQHSNDVWFGPYGVNCLTDSVFVIDNFAQDNKFRPELLDLDYDELSLWNGRKKGGQ